MFKNLRNKLAVLALVALGLAFGNALGSKPAEPTKTNGELIYDAIMNGQLPDEMGVWKIPQVGAEWSEERNSYKKNVSSEEKQRIVCAVQKLMINNDVVKYITIHNIGSNHTTADVRSSYLSSIGASGPNKINNALKRKLDEMDHSMKLSLQVPFFRVQQSTASTLQHEYTEKPSGVLYVLQHYFAAQIYNRHGASTLNEYTRKEINTFINEFSTNDVYIQKEGLTIAKKNRSKCRSLTLDIKDNTVYIRHFGPCGNPNKSN